MIQFEEPNHNDAYLFDKLGKNQQNKKPNPTKQVAKETELRIVANGSSNQGNMGQVAKPRDSLSLEQLSGHRVRPPTYKGIFKKTD